MPCSSSPDARYLPAARWPLKLNRLSIGSPHGFQARFFHGSLELVESGAGLGEVPAIDLPRPARRPGTPIIAELLAQLRRPARRILHLRRHVGVVERGLHHAGP